MILDLLWRKVSLWRKGISNWDLAWGRVGPKCGFGLERRERKIWGNVELVCGLVRFKCLVPF